MNKIYKVISATALLMLAFGNAQAAIVNFEITGDVVLGDNEGSPNVFGLNGGDTITAYGTFDDLGGNGTIDFTSTSGNTLTIDVGGTLFTAANDSDYFSTITLNNFALADFDFQAFAGLNGAAEDFNSNFTSFDDFNLFFGDWRTTIEYTAVVPVPAAVWLFGSGLIGLVGLARRKTA